MWLAKDKKHGSYVALKIKKSASHYLEAAFDEVEILYQVSNNWKCKEWQKSVKHYFKNQHYRVTSEDCYNIQILNAFIYYGPNGKHFVTVFEI